MCYRPFKQQCWKLEHTVISEVCWGRAVPAELEQRSAALETADKGKHSDASWDPHSIQTHSSNQTSTPHWSLDESWPAEGAQSGHGLQRSYWTSISLWHLTLDGHPCQAMQVGLSQSSSSCRLGKWICQCCCLGADFILEFRSHKLVYHIRGSWETSNSAQKAIV